MRYLLALLMTIFAAQAHAHLTPTTAIDLDFEATHADVTVTIPEGEWRYRYGATAFEDAALRRHFSAASASGAAWQVGPMKVERTVHLGGPDLVARFRMTPPAGQSSRNLTLRYDAIIDRVSSHAALVLVQSDFAGGLLPGEGRMIGALRGGKTSLAIDLGAASRFNGFTAVFRLGVGHILEGLDHLMFLLVLLLPAPLLVAGGQWNGPAGRGATIRHLVWIVTAFTIGHSLTLIGGAFFGWELPSQPVEIAIALSILISAIHALRPLFPGREALVAGGFGLIHGLAFATVIGNFALSSIDKAVAILGFNIGIEAVQLAMVALLLAPLLWLAARPAYRYFRIGGALIAVIASLFWLWERV